MLRRRPPGGGEHRLQRIGPEDRELGSARQLLFAQRTQDAEPPRIDVAQLEATFDREARVGVVGRASLTRGFAAVAGRVRTGMAPMLTKWLLPCKLRSRLPILRSVCT